MKLMLFVLSIVVLSLSSCFPVPVAYAPRPGYVRPHTTVRIYAPRPHYHGGHNNRHYNSNRGNRGGSPRGWR